jgi:hypothetical protein
VTTRTSIWFCLKFCPRRFLQATCREVHLCGLGLQRNAKPRAPRDILYLDSITHFKPKLWCISNCFFLRVSLYSVIFYYGAGIVQSVSRLATGWLEFESLYGKEFYFLHVVQIGSRAHPASYPMGTGDSFPEGKAGSA